MPIIPLERAIIASDVDLEPHMSQAARQCPSLQGAADPWPVSRQMCVTLMIPDRFTRALYRRYLDDAGYAVTEV